MEVNEHLKITCPYCGEVIELVMERDPDMQEYVEDCYVCCRPIQIQISPSSEGDPQINVSSEDG